MDESFQVKFIETVQVFLNKNLKIVQVKFTIFLAGWQC